MGAIRRFIVALLGLVSLGLTALVAVTLINHRFAVLALDYLDRCFLYNLELCFIDGRNLWLPLVVAIVALVVGVLLLVVALYRRRPIKQVTVETLDGGSVHVSLNAIDTVVHRAANQVTGVTNVTNRMQITKSGLHIRLSFSLPPDCNIAELGAALRQEINTHLDRMIGVRPSTIDISVVNVQDKPSGRHAAPAETVTPSASVEMAANPDGATASPVEGV